MVILCIVFTLLTINVIKCIFVSIKNNDKLGLFTCLCQIPFLIFMLSAFLLGGAPANNSAQVQYEFYEVGKYYLKTQGTFTEVTAQQYKYMEIMQIVGFSSAFLTLASEIAHAGKKKRKDKEKN